MGEEGKKRECSENSRRYYCAACMAPVILPFHLCFLLYWQMVVIRQYGNTVVTIVFTVFFFLWYLWPDDHHESVVVLNREPLCQRCLNQETNVCHMGMTHNLQKGWVFEKWGGVMCLCALQCAVTHHSVDICLKGLFDWLSSTTLINWHMPNTMPNICQSQFLKCDFLAVFLCFKSL